MSNVTALPISEDALHKIVAEWLALALGPETFWTTFPAGGGGMIRGANLKAMGLKKGVPDLLFVHQSQAYFIELKTAKGRLSDDQIDCHDDIIAAGGRVATCRSIKEVARMLKEWRIPYRVVGE